MNHVDPDKLLEDMHSAIADWHREGRSEDPDGTDAAAQAIDAAVMLDQWLAGGGFLPRAWATATSVPHVIVVVTGGNVSDAFANTPRIVVTLLDVDNLRAEHSLTRSEAEAYISERTDSLYPVPIS